MEPNEVADKPDLIAKIESLQAKLIAMRQVEARLRDCVDRLVGPAPMEAEPETPPNPTSVYELIDFMNVDARLLHEGLIDQTERLIRALGCDSDLNG